MQKARIKLASTDPAKLAEICGELKNITEKFGVVMKGPVPLPTKRLKVQTLKTPFGDGTGHGNAHYDNWEMRVHKRIVDVTADERTLRQIMRVHVPEGVHISIELRD